METSSPVPQEIPYARKRRQIGEKQAEREKYAKMIFEKENKWSPFTTPKDIKDKDGKTKAIYALSCCNMAYECTTQDGTEHCYCCGSDLCEGKSGCRCCICCCCCCWPCYLVPHKFRQCINVDYNDFFGGPKFIPPYRDEESAYGVDVPQAEVISIQVAEKV